MPSELRTTTVPSVVQIPFRARRSPNPSLRDIAQSTYVGEVGLDAGPRFYKSLEAQRDVFRTVLERFAAAGGKILTVHSVRTAPIVLDMIERHVPRGRATVVLHWFSGSASNARRVATMGCYFSVNTG